MKSLKLIASALLAFFIALQCKDMGNPYLDGADAGVRIVSKSFSDGDTMSIFSTESLSLVLNLKEHIDHIALHTSANRLWPGSDTIITADRFGYEPFTFRFSFYDTGWQEISIAAWRTTGDSALEKLRVYARSPLRQAAIGAEVGNTVRLSTPPVRDEVFYLWVFGNGMSIKSGDSDTSFIVTTPLTSGPGKLYVSDNSRRSPAAFFPVTMLKPAIPPAITIQPISKTVTEGVSAVFSVIAIGPDLSYQWQRNRTAINGATRTTYATPVTVFSDSGLLFRCIVRNSSGADTSAEALLSVTRKLVLPSISGPDSQSVVEGSSVTFSITVTGGTPPITYQWQRNETAIHKAKSADFTITSVLLQQNGERYRCIVTDPAGRDTSATAKLTVRAWAATIIDSLMHSY